MDSGPEVFVIAGEPSGDHHAAMLGEALMRRGGVTLAGVGQSRMRETGFELLFDSTGWSGIGVVESLKRVPRLIARKAQLVRHLLERSPDLLVLVDFGAFNVRLARSLRERLEAPILYYFPPRSWSRSADYRGLAGLFDRVATPFEWSEKLLRDAGLQAEWVGHPVVDRIKAADPVRKRRLREGFGIAGDDLVIGLLPGSRPTEIRCNGPQMLGAARSIAREIDSASFLLSRAPAIAEETLRAQIFRHELQSRTSVAEGVSEIVEAADFVITSCGTATLETAAAVCPMVIVYRGTALMSLEKRLRRFNPTFVGMPNIIAGEAIVPELIDQDALAPKIAQTALDLLTDKAKNDAMRERLVSVREKLGSPGVSDRVAGMLFDMIG